MRILKLILLLVLILTLCLFALVACVTPHKIQFLNEACIIPDKRYDYKTCADMNVLIDGENYTVPKSFKTDLATIPRLMWSVIAPQFTDFVAPSILHDYLYQSDKCVTRKFADEVLYSALLVNGVTPYTSIKFYLAVRIFGAKHFAKGTCTDGRTITENN